MPPEGACDHVAVRFAPAGADDERSSQTPTPQQTLHLFADFLRPVIIDDDRIHNASFPPSGIRRFAGPSPVPAACAGQPDIARRLDEDDDGPVQPRLEDDRGILR